MRRAGIKVARGWMHLGARFLPFADAATPDLPLSRLLRLALFQVSVGLATVLLIGTLNRVMIIELRVQAWFVAAMVSVPLLFAPWRALVGFRSDTHRSLLGWRRVPYIWMGSLLQFGGLAIMPFALIILSGDTHGPVLIGQVAAGLAFLLVGAGLQTTQTAGLALATDLAAPESRHRVVAFMYVMLLAGMMVAGIAFGLLLDNFSAVRLIQTIQGAAVVSIVLNGIALWKQEARNPSRTRPEDPRPSFAERWRIFIAQPGAARALVVIALGTAAFSMQEIVLEPYGAEILHLPVGSTSSLTALYAGGALVAFAFAARSLSRGSNPHRLAARGVLFGLLAFSAVIFSAPLGSPLLFRFGTALIGLGAGLFAVGTLACAMSHERGDENGLALGVWGAVQALAAGIAIVLGGVLRDAIGELIASGALGEALSRPDVPYSFVYHIEIGLLFAALAAIGPLARFSNQRTANQPHSFGLPDFPR